MVPAAGGFTGDFKTVEQQDLIATNRIIRVKATQIAALLSEPPKQLLEIHKALIIINGDLFQQLAPEMMCATWLYDEMVRTDTLICRSQYVQRSGHGDGDAPQ